MFLSTSIAYRYCYVVLLASIIPLLHAESVTSEDELLLTFVTANDGHWRPPEIDPLFDTLHQILIESINERGDVDLVIFNGDLVDRYAYIKWWNETFPDDTLNDAESRFNIPWLYNVREIYETLGMPFYVVQGNHDRATWEYWEEVWGYPAKHHFTVETYAFILMTRHDDRLVYLPPDYQWLEEILTKYNDKDGVFIFIHAGDGGVVNDEFREFISGYPNVKGIFFGHFHTDEVRKYDGLYYFWNGNFMFPFPYQNYRFGYRVVHIYRSGMIESYFMHLVNGGEKTNHVFISPTTLVNHEPETGLIPQEFNLLQNYPNPFNPRTVIEYDVPATSYIRLTVYNSVGQRIDTLVSEVQQAGRYQVTWEPAENLSSGIYFYRIVASKMYQIGDPYVQIQRMVYLR